MITNCIFQVKNDKNNLNIFIRNIICYVSFTMHLFKWYKNIRIFFHKTLIFFLLINYVKHV